jgi:class 3 adenylate cyclase
MRIGIGLSLDPDPAKAAAAAVAQAKKAVAKPDLALAFGSIHCDQAKIHEALCREIDPGILLGGSSYAEITNRGVTRGSVAVLLLAFDSASVALASTPDGLKEPYEMGKTLAQALSAPAGKNELLLALLSVGLFTNREDEIVDALCEHLGRVPVFGGRTCGDYDLGFSHPRFWTNYQYSERLAKTSGGRLALLRLPRQDYKLAFAFEHGWQPIGPVHQLTRCEGDKVFEIDGEPILEFYRQFLGRGHSDDFFELMVQRYGFSMQVEGGQSALVKVPVSSDLKAGYIAYSPATDFQGKKVQLIQSSRKSIVEGARKAAQRCLQALDGAQPSLVLVVSCCTRAAILHSQTDLELDAVRDVFGKDVPIFGYYSGGEFAPYLNRYDDIVDPAQPCSRSFYHATTITLLALSCSKASVSVVPSPQDAAPPLDKDAEISRLKILLEKSEKVRDDSESFLANLSRKSYQDGEQLRKQNEVIHRYTPHQVWTKVGASVAAGQYELPDSEFQGCFLFMDVKGFTSYSEERGPSEVVAALNTIFKPATETIYSSGGDVDKFIGDCIFAVFSKPDEALAAGRRLLELFSGLKAKGSPFAVRIGINMGRAVRANVGSQDRREYTFIGDSVNTAQRLEANCAPGKLLVGEELYQLGTVKFPFAERREILAKGKKNTVAAYELSL